VRVRVRFQVRVRVWVRFHVRYNPGDPGCNSSRCYKANIA
jgi:hypothetical protein